MKSKKKLIIIISIVAAFLIAGGLTAFFLLKGKDKPKEKEVIPIEVSALAQITPLEKGDSAEASELIKQNIVKVINTVGDNKIVGTGFFDKSGYLVTNSHIVDIEGELAIEYADGTSSVAQIFSNDITSDIALLAVENPKVKSMYYGETLSLRVTDKVYALGYPFALEGEASVTTGSLSARRSAGGIEFLQADISLNTGNSGGPLINDKGELLGINTYATDNASIGMAISSESLQTLIDKLIKDGKANYLEEKRPANALSVVLNEIGYSTEDIYNENKYIEKHDGIHDQGKGNNSESVDKYTACSNKYSSIINNSKLYIEGYYDGVNYKDLLNDLYGKPLVLKKLDNNLNIYFEYQGKKVDYFKISNNEDLKSGGRVIYVKFITPDCGQMYGNELHVIKPYTDPSPVSKMEMTMYPYKCSNGSGNCYSLAAYLRDADNIEVYPVEEHNPFFASVPLDSSAYNYIKVNLYYSYNSYDDSYNVVENNTLMKTYTFNDSELFNLVKEVPTSEIRELFTANEYHEGESIKIVAEVSFKNGKTIKYETNWPLER